MVLPVFVLILCLRRLQTQTTTMQVSNIITSTPPTTPPTIAPIGELGSRDSTAVEPLNVDTIEEGGGEWEGTDNTHDNDELSHNSLLPHAMQYMLAIVRLHHNYMYQPGAYRHNMVCDMA